MNNAVYRDVYNLHAECLERLNEPDFWDAVFWPKADALAGKHRRDVFFIDMMLAVHGDLERRQRHEAGDPGGRA